MLFRDLLCYVQEHMRPAQSIKPLLSAWFRHNLSGEPVSQVSKILNAEFRLIEFVTRGTFVVAPLSGRAAHLLRLLQEYIDVMEQTRLERSAQGKEFLTKPLRTIARKKR